MKIILALSAVALCALAHFDSSSPAPLTAEKKAEIKAKIQEKLSTLSTEAQTAGNQILAAFEANEGNMAASKAAVESILSGVSDSVKQELRTIIPGHLHGHHHRQTTPSA